MAMAGGRTVNAVFQATGSSTFAGDAPIPPPVLETTAVGLVWDRIILVIEGMGTA
jgi:hypothetical protein